MKNTMQKSKVGKANDANQFEILKGETKSGKPCIGLKTGLRLSKESFKQLLAEIQLAGGYGFTKYYPGKGNFITATNIDAETLTSLAKGHVWTKPEPKPEKTKKGPKNKTDKAKSNGIGALTDALTKGAISHAEFIAAIAALNK